ncbi:MAG: insulinase family protein [Bacteroidales bacterium]|nr:insulinase family protein [Bacteroidales bacterium]
MIPGSFVSGNPENPQDDFSVHYEKYRLPNGLTVILNTDKSNPITSLVIFYHVGSGRESPGKTGFAHLFEHIMFQRSENVGEDQFFRYIEGAGGNMNGGTSFDHTVYFEVVPKNALELAMWLESDRMGFLINSVTQSSFTLQQNVVQNEKRQYVDNVPYGFTDHVILKYLYPAGHPYSRDVIGEMEDIKNATIDDVKKFHRKYYVPNNATLVVSGDFEPEEVKTLIEKYFGEIPAGNVVSRPEPANIILNETRKLYHEDSFAGAPQFNMVFPTSENFSRDSYSLNVLSQLLGQGKKSPLHKVLVREKQLTSAVSVNNQALELTGNFRISITAKPDTSLAEVEKGIFEAFSTFGEEGFTENDLERIKARLETEFYNTISSVLFKSFMLAFYDVMAGSPDYLISELDRMKSVTAEDVWEVYNRYIRGKNYVATSFVPKGQLNLAAEGSVSAEIVEEDITRPVQVDIETETEEEIIKTPSGFDRSVAPVPGPDPEIKLPLVWSSVYPNGMKIHGIGRHELPIIACSLTIRGGHLLDDPEKAGVAQFMASMLNEGTRNKTPEELEEAIQLLGASLEITGSDEDITVSVNSLSRNFEKTIELVEEMLLEPRWDEEQFVLNKARIINKLKRNMSDPNCLANKAFNSLIFGRENILSVNAGGTVESVEKITINDLRTFYDKAISPAVAEFMIVGDISQSRVEKALAGLGKKWQNKKVNIPDPVFPPAAEKASIHFVNVPGAKQSVIKAGYPALPRKHEDFYKSLTANFMLGGGASARLFMVLREEKGYTYGAYSSFNGRGKYGTFSAHASVRSDATFESVMLFRDIMQEYRKGVSDDTVEFTKGSLLKANALRFETNEALLGMLRTMKLYGLPEDYIKQEEAYLRELTADRMNAIIRKYIDPLRMYYVVVGDAKTQLAALEKIGFGKPVLFQ